MPQIMETIMRKTVIFENLFKPIVYLVTFETDNRISIVWYSPHHINDEREKPNDSGSRIRLCPFSDCLILLIQNNCFLYCHCSPIKINVLPF